MTNHFKSCCFFVSIWAHPLAPAGRSVAVCWWPTRWSPTFLHCTSHLVKPMPLHVLHARRSVVTLGRLKHKEWRKLLRTRTEFGRDMPISCSLTICSSTIGTNQSPTAPQIRIWIQVFPLHSSDYPQKCPVYCMYRITSCTDLPTCLSTLGHGETINVYIHARHIRWIHQNIVHTRQHVQQDSSKDQIYTRDCCFVAFSPSRQCHVSLCHVGALGSWSHDHTCAVLPDKPRQAP